MGPQDTGTRADGGLIWSAPFSLEPGWLDGNGHLNMAYYHVLFDRTVDLAFDELGLGEAYRAEMGGSTFNVETHVVYRREVGSGDRVRCSFQLLGCDEKRLHAFQTMENAAGTVVATSESMFVHVSLATRRAAPFPADRLEAVRAMGAAHRAAGVPEGAGRRIAPLAP